MWKTCNYCSPGKPLAWSTMRSPGCEPSPLTCLTLSPYAIMLTLDKTQLFGHIVEQHVNDAAFLWLQRSLAVKHAHHTAARSEEHTSELQSRGHLVCRR